MKYVTTTVCVEVSKMHRGRGVVYFEAHAVDEHKFIVATSYTNMLAISRNCLCKPHLGNNLTTKYDTVPPQQKQLHWKR